MGAIKEMVTGEQESVKAAFLALYPTLDTAAVSGRWDGAWGLYRQNTVRPIAGVPAGSAYEVRCSHPERTRPGEPVSYTVTLRGTEPRAWTCECADWLYRGVVCKHMIAGGLHRTMGAAPSPWGISWRGGADLPHRDGDYEAWLDSLPAGRTADEQEAVNDAADAAAEQRQEFVRLLDRLNPEQLRAALAALRAWAWAAPCGPGGKGPC